MCIAYREFYEYIYEYASRRKSRTKIINYNCVSNYNKRIAHYRGSATAFELILSYKLHTPSNPTSKFIYIFFARSKFSRILLRALLMELVLVLFMNGSYMLSRLVGEETSPNCRERRDP